MRYCIGFLHKPTRDGRSIGSLDLRSHQAVPIFGLATVRWARNIHLVRGEIICSADIIVGSSQSLTMSVGDCDVLYGEGSRATLYGGHVESLVVADAASAWPELNGRGCWR